MTAAAAGSRLTSALVGEPSTAREAAVAVAVAAGGGLVEGLALGGAQATGLAGYLPLRARRQWVGVTAVVATVGWAVGSLPSTMMGTDTGADPQRLLVVAGGAGLGAFMGLLLGAGQSLVLRGHVPRPARWVVASVAGWVPAMAIIFVAAGTPEASWSTASVAGLGTLTGLVAGAVLGAVTAPFVTNGRLRHAQPPVRGAEPR